MSSSNATPSGLRVPVIKPGKANVRTVFQLCAETHQTRGESPEDILVEARRIVLDWLRGKFPEPLPQTAHSGETFECGEHGQKILGITVPEEGIWTVRLEQPDAPAPFGDRPAVPGRFWTTDIALRGQGERVLLGVRVQCASLAFAHEPIVLTRPRVVPDLANRFLLREARDLDGKPWNLESFEDLQEFESFLLDPMRNMPVVLLTQPDQKKLHVGVSEFLLDPDWLASRLQGFGYVATMPRQLGFHWTDLVGKPWSAFLGAVRTYMPGMDYDQDTPNMHPLAFADKILFWRHADDRGEHKGERAFERFLVARAREHAAGKRVDWRGCIFVPEAKPLRAALLRQRTESKEELGQLYEQEIEALQEQLREAGEHEAAAVELATAAERERDYYREENARLRAYNETLRARLTDQTGEGDVPEEVPPTEYRDLPEWIERTFVGRLELHSRAIRGLKKAVYEDIGVVCQAVRILANEYRNMRLGHDGAMDSWQRSLREAGLEFSGSITDNRAGEQGDSYFIDYPPHSGNRRLMEFHLRRGNSRDPRHCLRIYYFWDDESQQVVVGWLPEHLETRAS